MFPNELAKIWFTNSRVEKETKGFGHIFCGEPDRLRLGGMHFVGRYVEAQEHEWAGAIWDLCNKLDIKPSTCLYIGMKYVGKDGEVKVKYIFILYYIFYKNIYTFTFLASMES